MFSKLPVSSEASLRYVVEVLHKLLGVPISTLDSKKAYLLEYTDEACSYNAASVLHFQGCTLTKSTNLSRYSELNELGTSLVHFATQDHFTDDPVVFCSGCFCDLNLSKDVIALLKQYNVFAYLRDLLHAKRILEIDFSKAKAALFYSLNRVQCFLAVFETHSEYFAKAAAQKDFPLATNQAFLFLLDVINTIATDLRTSVTELKKKANSKEYYSFLTACFPLGLSAGKRAEDPVEFVFNKGQFYLFHVYKYEVKGFLNDISNHNGLVLPVLTDMPSTVMSLEMLMYELLRAGAGLTKKLDFIILPGDPRMCFDGSILPVFSNGVILNSMPSKDFLKTVQCLYDPNAAISLREVVNGIEMLSI